MSPDLLALLHEQGPSTEGIFRLAASERASREIREALDSGTEVHLASQPVHVLAVILKDFLRKIPSKLLVAELYQQWMAALQKSSREERLVGLKEVARELPEANLLLLNTLLRLLQNISSNATVSKMTASNLAICVGPNLLGPPEEDTLPLDTLVQATAKVTQLVEFLINHREELFEAEEEREEEEEGAGLAAEGAEESPAAGAEAESAEVGEVHKQRERMPPPSEGGIAAAGTSKFIHPPAALHKCRVRLMQVGHHSLCSDPSRSGTAGLSKAIQGICLLELSWKTGRAHLLRFHCRCLQSLQKAKARIAPLGRAGNVS
ncbi:T-cell activation Rho GTPase-activating protein [Columba livia]|uniref:T-cell activation Rho GTPase-activating protein n=1 Tax=Columba livia TaxID=8932 RepID=UPI0031BB7DF1